MAIYMWRDVPDYLYFHASTSNGGTVSLTKTGTPTSVNLETSTDLNTWTDYTIGDTITLSNQGDRVYFRNKSETPTGFSIDSSNYYKFNTSTGAKMLYVGGDANTLLCKYSTNQVGNYCFYRLFYSNTLLFGGPTLPATVLGEYCYAYMFYGTKVDRISALPATTLPNYCYQRMYSNASQIKLSTTQNGTYTNEYRIPTTGTGTVGTNSLQYMFTSTGGVFTSEPSINTTYYTSNQVI